MADFEDFKDALREGVKALLKHYAKKKAKTIARAFEHFLADTEADMKRWTQQLAAGQLSQDYFKDLVKGQQDLFKVKMLTEAGIAKAEAQRLREQFRSLLIDTAMRVFL